MIGERKVAPTNEGAYMGEDYEGMTYYYTPEDAFCPYLNPTREVFDHAPRPFVMFNIIDESEFGVEMAMGRNVIARPHEWSATQLKEIRRLDRLFDQARTSSLVMPGSHMTIEEMRRLGDLHFEHYNFQDADINAFLRYAAGRELLVIETVVNGEVVLVDVSVTVPERNEVCGIFCNWNPKYKRLSPGIYACVLAARDVESRWGVKYNIGQEYTYKQKVATGYEKTYGVALVPDGHPLLLDASEKNPIMAFRRDDLNKVMRGA